MKKYDTINKRTFYEYVTILDENKKYYCDNIFTFDIETTSFFKLNGKIYSMDKYLDLSEKEKEECEFGCTMYEWSFGINRNIYYGRTYEDFKNFLDTLFSDINFKRIKKYLFIHNFSFEFQFLKSEFNFEDVLARKKYKVIKALLYDYNFEVHCTYFLSNAKLADLPHLFKLPVEKLVGDLDYMKIRHSQTPLTEDELKYCENDCLIIYYYIRELLEEYLYLHKLPITSTGFVRRELKEILQNDYKYLNKERKNQNVNPHLYNLLNEAFAGGITHANYIYTEKIIKNVDSYDFKSSYPYVMLTEKYPIESFKRCILKTFENLITNFAYIFKIKFYNIKSKFYNNIISMSKCISISNGAYDNGRVMKADYLTITVNEVDLELIKKAYSFSNYEIIESYYAKKDYLNINIIEFILKKYKNKTEYKNREGFEIDYIKEKNKFNAIYGMSVTNNIRDEVVYTNDTQEWSEIPLTNDDILDKLIEQKNRPFLSFSYGVWVTAYARRNLVENILKLDYHTIYCDTDSIKLAEGYDKNVIKEYNEKVVAKIKKVCKVLNLNFEDFCPEDVKGEKHLIGLFEFEGKGEHTYDKFITQGAKKYAYEVNNEIFITVAGVPKIGRNCLKKLEDFKDNLIFDYTVTNKNTLVYVENQEPVELTDYLGNKMTIKDKSGCCLVPTNYTLGKSMDYAILVSEYSSQRAVYKED